MANARFSYCRTPRCTNKVASGYCPTCRPLATAHHRPQGAHGQGYTRRWERFRREEFPFLLAEAGKPVVCGARLPEGPSPHSRCAAEGLLVFERLHLDHDPPLEPWERRFPERVCDPLRVAYLCVRDHSAKTLKERRLC